MAQQVPSVWPASQTTMYAPQTHLVSQVILKGTLESDSNIDNTQQPPSLEVPDGLARVVKPPSATCSQWKAQRNLVNLLWPYRRERLLLCSRW